MKYFIVSWDCNGFECIEDITAEHPDEWAKTNLFNTIKNPTTPVVSPLMHQVSAMMMRARFNSQRNYEIYVFTAQDSVDKESVREWAETQPQAAADWIRLNHTTKLFGSSRSNNPVIV